MNIPQLKASLSFSVFAVVCFFPIIFEWHFDSIGDYNHLAHPPVNDPMVGAGNIILLSISGYMIYEAILDSFTLRSCWNVAVPRWVMILAVFASCLLFFYSDNNQPERKLAVYTCCIYGRACFYILQVFAALYGSSSMQKISHYTVFVLVMFVSVCYTFYPFGKLGALQTITPYLAILGYAVAMVVCGKGFYSGFRDIMSSDVSGFTKYRSIYYFIVAAYMLSSLTVSVSHGNKSWTAAPPEELAGYLGIDIAILSMAYTIPIRMAQYDAAVIKVRHFV
jgi:hypothetical protein